jgi:hypothetical protein
VSGTKALWLALAAFLAAPAAAEVPGQLTVAASSISGDWGTGVDTDRRSALVRFVWGGKTRLRGDLEFLDLRSDGPLVVQTPFGPVAAGQRSGPGPGGSGSGSGSGGSGSGPGTPGGSPPPPGEPETLPVADERSSGVGDLRLGVERTLVGGGGRLFRLDAEVGVKVPTADEEEYLGTGEWDYRIGLGSEYQFWTGTLFAGAGWNRLGDPAWTVLEDVLDAYIGMASDPLAGGLVVAGWLEANQEVLAGAGDRTAAGLSVHGGGRLRWRIELTAGLSGSAEDLSAAFGLSLGTDVLGAGRRRG